MSAPLPHFEPGETLRADKLNALVARVRALQARQVGGGAYEHRSRRVLPCRHYAFELAELSGVLYYRQGWIDPGTGEPVPVGEQEWNVLGRLAPCTVWLEFKGSEPDDCTAEVVLGEYDESTPETNFRRRLGYVREAEPVDNVPIYHCVQVAGGLMTPCAPRRTMGAHSLAEPDKFCKCDSTRYGLCASGAAYGEGFTVADYPDETYRGRVSWGYACEIDGDDFSVERGGWRMTQSLFFGRVW